MKKILPILCCILFTTQSALSTIKPTNLTCEYLKNPSVVDIKNPRLSWINISEANERGQEQTAWQIRVATSKELLENPDLWDSKKTESNQSNRILYQGKELKSRQNCWWQVKVWDKDNISSDWSKPAYWHMGLLSESDWEATWIGAPWQGEEPLPKPMNPNAALPEQLPPPAPMFRKEFNINKNIENATVYVTGLGYFELYLNGTKVGNDVLVPNQTNYGKRPNLQNQNIPLPDDFKEYKVMYLAYDVKKQLKEGINAIGSILGNGFYNPAKYWAEAYGTPRFLMQLHLTYTDGSDEIISTDKSWKASKSPILMDMVYYGEHYDARKEQVGWCTPEFNDTVWQQVVERKAPEGKLAAHTAHPDKIVEN
jgi:alpha-L-rhamnosidase